MAMDGFPIGFLLFVDYSECLSFFNSLQILKYEVKLRDMCIYAYDSKEFYEMSALSSGISDAYIISEINAIGAKYRKLSKVTL